ncbi:hypothetical protein AHAS_Ahas13G0283100 [Arachis hypogaea]
MDLTAFYLLCVACVCEHARDAAIGLCQEVLRTRSTYILPVFVIVCLLVCVVLPELEVLEVWFASASASYLMWITYEGLSPRTKILLAFCVQLAGSLITLARLKAAMTQDTESEGGGASLSMPQSQPQSDSRTVSQEMVSIGVAGVVSTGATGVEVDEEVVVVPAPEASKKRRKVVEGSSGEIMEEEGPVPSVMDQSFDASVFIDKHLLLGMEEFFHDRDILVTELKRSSDAESTVASLLAEAETLRADVAKLKKEKNGLLKDAKDAISATEEIMKAQSMCWLPR